MDEPARNGKFGTERKLPVIYLAFLSLAMVISYWPLCGYYFAQDDFVLLEKAAFTPGAAITDFFGSGTVQFRPLTRGVFFVVAYRIFGLNPVGYHVVCLLLHLVNTLLVYAALRRFRCGVPAALLGTTLFSLNGAFFHVLAWISCVQQLLAVTFALSSLVLTIDSIEQADRRKRWLGFFLYCAAVASFEMTVFLPVVVLTYGLGIGEWTGPARRRAVTATIEQWIVLFCYLVIGVGSKGLPADGVYRFQYGQNVAVNLLTYVGYSLQLWMRLPVSLEQERAPFMWGQVLVVVVVVYHILRRRWPVAVFGCTFFLVTIFPALFLTHHTYYLHTYLPSIGLIYIITAVIDDACRGRRLFAGENSYGVLGIALLLLAAMSFIGTRGNERMRLNESVTWKRSFVLRRSLAAENICAGVSSRKNKQAKTVYMVYGRVRDAEHALWNNLNVVEAIGRGAAIRLLYKNPDLDVQFTTTSDFTVPTDLATADVFFYDDMGNISSHARTGPGPKMN